MYSGTRYLSGGLRFGLQGCVGLLQRGKRGVSGGGALTSLGCGLHNDNITPPMPWHIGNAECEKVRTAGPTNLDRRLQLCLQIIICLG